MISICAQLSAEWESDLLYIAAEGTELSRSCNAEMCALGNDEAVVSAAQVLQPAQIGSR